MKKSTLFLLAGAAVLAIITILVTSKGSEPPPKKLAISGYATEAQLAADRARGIMDSPLEIDSPVDEVIIVRDAAGVAGKPELASEIHAVREGTGKEATWKLTAPVAAPAVKYQIDKIVENFKSPTNSKYARALKPADLARYDFEPARRVRLTLKSKGAVWNGVDLVIGRVEKGEAGPQGGEAIADTWVMQGDDATTAYLVAAKDLRTAVDADLGGLRDKKVFSFDGDDVTKVEITSPDGKVAVLEGTRTETPPPAPEPGPDGQTPPPDPNAKPTVKVDWKLTAPAGVAGDTSVSAYAKSLSGLRVNDFVPLDKADAEATAALAGKVWSIKADVKVKGQDPVTSYVLKIADGGGDVVWAQLEGKPELFSIASYSAKNLRKGIDDLKNKVVYDVVPEDVTELTLKGDTGPITLVRGDKTWAFTVPAVAFPGDPGMVLKQLAKVTAVRWARPDELEAARAALAAPDISAVVKTKDGTARAVSFSKQIEGGDGDKNRWGVVGDAATGEVFQIQDYNAKRFETTVAAMRWKKLLTVDKAQIQRVEITTTGAEGKATTTALERAPSESGAGELAVVDAPAGKRTKEDAARTIGSTLSALDAKSFHEGMAVAETGLDPAKANKVVVKLADGSALTLLISTKSAGEGELYGVIDGGPLANVVVGLNEYQAKNLTKSQADLLEDAPAPNPVPAPAPAPAPGP